MAYLSRVRTCSRVALRRQDSRCVVPFTFFPDWFQMTMNYLPFQYISYVPVTIYLGKRQGPALQEALLVQLAWAIGLFLLARLVWRLSVRNVIVQGG